MLRYLVALLFLVGQIHAQYIVGPAVDATPSHGVARSDT